jgi:hypothetical protein
MFIISKVSDVSVWSVKIGGAASTNHPPSRIVRASRAGAVPPALLIAPGSSFGGARPKASVLDSDQSLWIAKFPGKDDDRDVGAWEMLTAQLAQEAGVEMSEYKLESISKRGSPIL